jgi:hypothetical protein
MHVSEKIDDLFSQPKKVILKELEQSSADCSNFDDTDQRLTVLLFYFWRKMVKNYFIFFFLGGEMDSGGKRTRPHSRLAVLIIRKSRFVNFVILVVLRWIA